MYSERNANHAQHNTIKAIAIFVTVAFLLNTIAPTLAHAATYLQGAEVNADTLVRDAYVQVIYRDRNDEQKLAKGWIDAIGETSFTIREGGFRDKKTIAYDKVVSVIRSEESTVPAKQMNEVNRFIRTMGNTQQAIQWAETVTVMPRGQIDLSKIAKGLYAHVVYTSEDKKKKIAVGRITDKDSEHLMIQEAKYRSGRYKKIAYSDIDILAVAKYQQDIARWENARQAIQLLHEGNTKVRFKAPSVSKKRIVGRLVEVVKDTLVIQGGHTFFQVSLSSISNLEVSLGQYRNTAKGLLIGLGLGSAIVTLSFRHAEHLEETGPYDSLDGLATALGGMFLGGLVLVVSTFTGVAKKSDKWVEVPPQRLNLSVAPTSAKGLRTALTFNF